MRTTLACYPWKLPPGILRTCPAPTSGNGQHWNLQRLIKVREQRPGGSGQALLPLVGEAGPVSLQASMAAPRPKPHVLCALRKASPGAGWEPSGFQERRTLASSLACSPWFTGRSWLAGHPPHLTFSHTNQPFRLPWELPFATGATLKKKKKEKKEKRKNSLCSMFNYPSEDLTNLILLLSVDKDACFIRFSPTLSIKTGFYLCQIVLKTILTIFLGGVFLGPHPWHMEVLRLGGDSEL